MVKTIINNYRNIEKYFLTNLEEKDFNLLIDYFERNYAFFDLNGTPRPIDQKCTCDIIRTISKIIVEINSLSKYIPYNWEDIVSEYKSIVEKNLVYEYQKPGLDTNAKKDYFGIWSQLRSFFIFNKILKIESNKKEVIRITSNN